MRSTSETDSLLSSPPPPYSTYDNQNMHVPGHSRHARRHRDEEGSSNKRRGMMFLLAFFGLISVGFVLCITLNMPRAIDRLDTIERERIRQEWQKECEAFAEEQRERNRTRSRWESEDAERMHQRHQWEVERREYNREVQEWLEERAYRRHQWKVERREHESEVQRWLEERAHQLGMLWSEPQAVRCMVYGTREYTAQLDEIAVCKISPLVIQGMNATASTCTPGSGVTGHFVVDYDDPTCHPYWGDMYDKGCISSGPRGMRRVEARLWGLHQGDDWEGMCSTTPAVVNGIEFTGPSRCEYRGVFYGMVGMFEYLDRICGWNGSTNIIEDDPEEAMHMWIEMCSSHTLPPSSPLQRNLS